MPSSRAPQGIQFDSPLQRQWMSRSSNGRIARNAATVAGASASSKRARKVNPAAQILSTPGRYRDASQRASVFRSAWVIPVAFASGIAAESTATEPISVAADSI